MIEYPCPGRRFNMPTISVIMPVYNGEKYLSDSIKSILNQTFSDFEFIIINDCSTDSSLKIIKSFADKRIILISNSQQLRITASLNKGLKRAQGKYIARMDSDDISLPNRFITQVKFLERNPDIGVAGTWVKLFGRLNGTLRYPTDPEIIKANLLFNTSLCHPSVMINTRLLNKNHLKYDESVPNGQDYELWTRASDCFKLANIPQVLLHYRMHAFQEGITHFQQRAKLVDQIRSRLLTKLGISVKSKYLSLHSRLSLGWYEKNNKFLNDTEAWLQTIVEANKMTKRYNKKALQTVLVQKWFDTCEAQKLYLIDIETRFLRSPVLKDYPFPWKKAAILCLSSLKHLVFHK